MDYLCELSDLELVKEHLALGQAKEMEQKEAELAGVSKALGDLEGQLLQHLDPLIQQGNEVDHLKAGDLPIWTRVREEDSWITIHVRGLSKEGEDRIAGFHPRCLKLTGQSASSSRPNTGRQGSAEPGQLG